MNRNERAEPAIQDKKTESVNPHTSSYPYRRLARWCSGLSVAAWSLHLFVIYALVEWHCRIRTLEDDSLKLIIYAVTAVLFLTAIVCTIVSGKKVQERKQHASKTQQGVFSVRFTTWFCGFLSAIILVQTLPVLWVSLCIK